jgi:phosphate transport system permease protein
MTEPTTNSLAPRALVGSAARRRRERFVRWVFMGAALTSVLVSIFIIQALVGGAAQFISLVDLPQLMTDGWFPRRGLFDLRTLIAGSLIVTLVAVAVAAPVGLASAVYLSEYAQPRTRRIVKPILEILAGVPSVVLGFFALTWINPQIVQRLFSGAEGFNLLAAGIGVGVLTVPLIASIAEDAMRAVPQGLREASYGLGARRVTTSLRVVLPAATSGVVAAMILGISRAVGETMVVAIAAGGSGGSLFSLDPTQSGQTITAAMASLATGSDQVVGNNAAFQSLFFLGLVLFLLTFLLNQIGDVFVQRTRQQY